MRVQRAETEAERAAAFAVRHAVFTAEQGIDAAADRDGRDNGATHLIAVAEADDPVPSASVESAESAASAASAESSESGEPAVAESSGSSGSASAPVESVAGTGSLTAVEGVAGDPGAAGGADERVVGAARYRETGEVVRGERLSVLAPVRGEGYGSALVRRLLRDASRLGADRVVVHAQAQNVPFCRAHGFRETGERFEEVGREHAEMVHPLEDVPSSDRA